MGRSKNLGDCVVWYVSLTKTEVVAIMRLGVAVRCEGSDVGMPQDVFGDATGLHIRMGQKIEGETGTSES